MKNRLSRLSSTHCHLIYIMHLIVIRTERILKIISDLLSQDLGNFIKFHIFSQIPACYFSISEKSNWLTDVGFEPWWDGESQARFQQEQNEILKRLVTFKLSILMKTFLSFVTVKQK